uniref:Putative secreted protein n=2 Tax=Anopheles triannulatus TaxID=58253 RepID=A0A2M4A6A6_9DIPT
MLTTLVCGSLTLCCWCCLFCSFSSSLFDSLARSSIRIFGFVSTVFSESFCFSSFGSSSSILLSSFSSLCCSSTMSFSMRTSTVRSIWALPSSTFDTSSFSCSSSCSIFTSSMLSFRIDPAAPPTPFSCTSFPFSCPSVEMSVKLLRLIAAIEGRAISSSSVARCSTALLAV